MSVKVPEIIEILHACKAAYICGRGSVGKPRLARAKHEGLSKRRFGPTKRTIAAIEKEGDFPKNIAWGPGRRMLLAAFDLGLAHQQEEEE